MNNLQDAIDYFKNEAGYSRLFEKFAAKMESIGHIGGSIIISNLTDNEKRVLRNWFGRDYSKKTSATVSLGRFEKKLEETKFQGVDFHKVVEVVVGREIFYKKDVKQLEEAKNDFFRQLVNQYPSQNTN
ncbi:MAG TPA: hypothetical protein GX497_10785 [Bacillus bacterium]|nr:hypothetical protein [Bacillus sp. (in: firmicutes)]